MQFNNPKMHILSSWTARGLCGLLEFSQALADFARLKFTQYFIAYLGCVYLPESILYNSS